MLKIKMNDSFVRDFSTHRTPCSDKPICIHMGCLKTGHPEICLKRWFIIFCIEVAISGVYQICRRIQITIYINIYYVSIILISWFIPQFFLVHYGTFSYILHFQAMEFVSVCLVPCFHEVQVLRTASHRRVVVENSCSRLVFKDQLNPFGFGAVVAGGCDIWFIGLRTRYNQPFWDSFNTNFHSGLMALMGILFSTN